MLFLASVIFLSLVQIERFVAIRSPINLTAFFAGVAYIRRNPIVLGIISLDLFAVLLGGTTALLPIFADEIFNVGPEGLGLLRAAPAAGALAVMAVLTIWPISRRVGRIMLRQRGIVRARDGGVRAVEVVRPVDGCAGRARRVGRGERGHPQ